MEFAPPWVAEPDRWLICVCIFLWLIGWSNRWLLVGFFVGVGFELAQGGFARFAGFQLTWDVFFWVEFFFFFGLGWLCYIFGLIWYFGVLGFDHDFAGFEKSLPLSFMILFSSWNFLGFSCVCFLRKFLGFLVCLLGNNMIFMCWERKNVLTKKLINK